MIALRGARLAAVTLSVMAVSASAQGGAEAVDIPQEFNDPTIYVCPDGKYQSGCTAEDVERAVRIDQDMVAKLESQCLYRSEARCYPMAFGGIMSVEQGRPLTWQHMALFPKDGPRVEMLVIAEGAGALDWTILSARQTDGWFAPPALVENSKALMLLHAPGRRAGSGAGNADILLSRHDQGWTSFDVDDLLDQAAALLPGGFSRGGGVQFDFREMFAAVPVKRASDGGCCATGGTMFIDFDMPQGNLMEVASIRFEETQPVNTHRSRPPRATPD